jgi:hypothetical protein
MPAPARWARSTLNTIRASGTAGRKSICLLFNLPPIAELRAAEKKTHDF